MRQRRNGSPKRVPATRRAAEAIALERVLRETAIAESQAGMEAQVDAAVARFIERAQRRRAQPSSDRLTSWQQLADPLPGE